MTEAERKKLDDDIHKTIVQKANTQIKLGRLSSKLARLTEKKMGYKETGP